MSLDSSCPVTIAQFLPNLAALPAGSPALHVMHDDAARDYVLDWHQVLDMAARWARAIEKLGVQPGDRVGHLAENRWEWAIADLALHLVGAVHVPMHAPLTSSQVAYQVEHSGCRMVMTSTPEQTEKLKNLPSSLTRITYDDHGGLPTIHELSGEVQADLLAQIDQAVRRDQGDQMSTILYTSGTTGEPKGVMLSQANLATNAYLACEAFGNRETDVRLTFLPLSHIFARTCDLYSWVVRGAQLAIARRRETVVEDCHRVRPTVINGVPYFFERLRRALEQNGPAPAGSLRALLGGRIRSCGSGGAALPVHLFDFFHEQGVPVLQGYGLTETSPVVSVSTESDNRRGASGRALTHALIRIDDDGEILTAGPQVMMGYYRRPQDTAEVMTDGWFRTGDLGRIDQDGYLWITGRKKEIIVTSGGKNIAPVLLESLITRDPFIEQALVIGDDRPFLTALVHLNATALEELLRNDPGLQAEVAANGREAALARWAQSRVEAQLQEVSYYEQVRRITVLSRAFTIDAGELTPKLSMRRGVINEHYAAQIEAMYQREA